MPKHRWWHVFRPAEEVYSHGFVFAFCGVCHKELYRAKDDGYRCVVCGSAFCSPEEHH